MSKCQLTTMLAIVMCSTIQIHFMDNLHLCEVVTQELVNSLCTPQLKHHGRQSPTGFFLIPHENHQQKILLKKVCIKQ